MSGKEASDDVDIMTLKVMTIDSIMHVLVVMLKLEVNI